MIAAGEATSATIPRSPRPQIARLDALVAAPRRPHLPMRRIRSVGCARATSGHAAATPPRTVMNSRRRIAFASLREVWRHLTATGATVEPVAPWSFNGCMMKANSETPFAASSSSLRFSNRCTPWFTRAIW
jgi:hypothetical protein